MHARAVATANRSQEAKDTLFRSAAALCYRDDVNRESMLNFICTVDGGACPPPAAQVTVTPPQLNICRHVRVYLTQGACI